MPCQFCRYRNDLGFIVSRFRVPPAPPRLFRRGPQKTTGIDVPFLNIDAYLLGLGSYSPLLLVPLGIRLPVYPVKGYSITVPITDSDRAPVSTGDLGRFGRSSLLPPCHSGPLRRVALPSRRQPCRGEFQVGASPDDA
jgi:hypothetical protein